MNLLLNRKNIDYFDKITPISFRKHQYEFILDFVEICIDFISTQNNNYLSIQNKSINDRINYTGIYNSKISHIEIKTKMNNGISELFTSFFIPTLIDNNHFYLNGKYYTPALYLKDYPISIKKKSIMIDSLFNSISIYTKEDLVSFTGRNFSLDSFIQLFIDFDDPIYTEYRNLQKLVNHKKWEIDNLVELYSKKFSIKELHIDKIIEKIESLFLDTYTYYLFERCYPNQLNEINLKNILLLALNNSNNNEIKTFNNLDNKRIVFMEFLLTPFIKKCSALANEVSKGVNKNNLKIDEYLVYKYFFKSKNPDKVFSDGLSGNFIYDTKNLFSTILQPKGTFITPGMNMPPKEVNYVNDSHFRKICPITVSSIDPGESVSLIPDIELDEFGIFKRK